MSSFDYNAPAEPFGNRDTSRHGRAAKYRRFTSGAEALRFVMEDVPPLLPGIILESNETRYDHLAIRALYNRVDYPLDGVNDSGVAACILPTVSGKAIEGDFLPSHLLR